MFVDAIVPVQEAGRGGSGGKNGAIADLFQQANGLFWRRKVHEACSLYEAVLRTDPGHVDALHCLGLIRAQQGKLDEAIDLLLKVIGLTPDAAEAHSNLGNMFAATRRFKHAECHYEKALALKPSMAEARNNYGNLLAGLNRHEEALAMFRGAIAEKRGKYPEALANLGLLLVELGRTDEARQALEQAIECAPRRANFYRHIAYTKTFSTDDPHLATMKDLARSVDRLPLDQQMELHFALGKAFADIRDYKSSFQHMLSGNRLKRSQIAYDERDVFAKLEGARDVYTAQVIRERRASNGSAAAPIFVVGMPRSGTTLVEQILSSHPQVFGAGELAYFEEEMLNIQKARKLDPQPPNLLAHFSDADLGHLGRRYLARVQAQFGALTAGKRITDKMPSNFIFVGLIHLALPNARIVHIRRNPLDTCLSCFSRLFVGALPYVYDLAELGRFYRGYDALMRHWQAVLPAGVMLEVQYEDLVADFEAQARRLVSFCGLDWNAACLEFHKTARVVRTASATQVRKPLYGSAVGRWRVYGEQLRPLIDALGDLAADVAAPTDQPSRFANARPVAANAAALS